MQGVEEITDDDLATALQQNLDGYEEIIEEPQQPRYPPPPWRVKEEQTDDGEAEYSEQEWADWLAWQDASWESSWAENEWKGWKGHAVMKDEVEDDKGNPQHLELGVALPAGHPHETETEKEKDVSKYPSWAVRDRDISRAYGLQGNAGRDDGWGGHYDERGYYHDPNGHSWQYLVHFQFV